MIEGGDEGGGNKKKSLIKQNNNILCFISVAIKTVGRGTSTTDKLPSQL